MTLRHVVIAMWIVQVLGLAVLGLRVGKLARLERQDRELIAGLESNYQLERTLWRLSR